MKPFDVRKLRAKTKLNQSEFWSPIGISQSGGSRYEGGRAIPKPVRILLDLAYGSISKCSKMFGKVRWVR